MNPVFAITIAEMANGQFYAVIKSLEEQKARAIQAPSLKLLMTRIAKDVRKRHQLLQRFPTPRQSPILQPGQAQILWTPNGH